MGKIRGTQRAKCCDVYIEEDSVQALEQLVSEKFGIARDASSLAGKRRSLPRAAEFF
jgi:hypothetical protein